MKRCVRICVAAVMIAALFVPAASPAFAQTTAALESGRVVLILAPYLHWNDIAGGRAPNLMRIAEEGAVGDINVRNRNLVSEGDSPEQGALTFSAGSWAAADPLSPSAYAVEEYYEGGTSAEAFERMTGVSPEGYGIVFLGMPRTQRLNEAYTTLEVVVGTIGQAIEDAGGVTAAIGNSDSGYEVAGLWRSRPSALVAMDARGLVRYGDVSTELLENDAAAPYGFRTDLDAFGDALREAESSLADVDGPGLIVLDTGDLQRATEFAPDVTPEVAEDHHAQAVETLDAVVGMVLETLTEDATLIVAPQIVDDTPEVLAGLGPIVVYGEGWQGYLSSSSTQREGLVTNLDMAATVLGVLGIERPTHVLGNVMESDGSAASLDSRVVRLEELNETAIAIDSAKPTILNGYITITTLILLVATVVLLRAHRWHPAPTHSIASAFRNALLFVLAVPPASTLMFVFDVRPENAAQAVGMFALVAVVLWVFALALERFARLRIPVATLSLLAAATLLVDQWLGAPLSFSSFLGYSPLLAARYYGLGNEGAALLMGALLVGLAYLFDEFPDSRATRFGRTWGIPLAGAVMVVTSAAPFWGANVGVAAWGVVGFAVAWALMNGVRISWKLMLAALIVIVLVVAAFSFIDLSADDGAQTHLGRAWSSAASGGFGELWLIVVRKAETNLRVLTRTNWSYLLVAVLAFLGFMRWRPQGDFAATLDENPHFSAAMAACLIGGAAAYLTEDSGIVIPALIMLYVGAGILYLMLSRLIDGSQASSAQIESSPAEDSAAEVPAR